MDQLGVAEHHRHARRQDPSAARPEDVVQLQRGAHDDHDIQKLVGNRLGKVLRQSPSPESAAEHVRLQMRDPLAEQKPE